MAGSVRTWSPRLRLVPPLRDRLASKAPRRVMGVVEIEQVHANFGERFVCAFEASVATLDGRHGRHGRRFFNAALQFFLWLSTCDADSGVGRAVVGLYSGDGRSGSGAADVDLVASALWSWYEQHLPSLGYAATYRHDLACDCAHVLQQLSRDNGVGSPYPAFERGFFRTFRPLGYIKSLGELDIPELAGLRGLAADYEGIALVRSRFLKEFDLHEKAFEFGLSVLSGATPPGTSVAARELVRNCLLALREAVGSPGRVQSFGDVVRYMPRSVVAGDTWADAGLETACLTRWWPNSGEISFRALAAVALACIGSSLGSFLAVAGAFVAATGWNRQPLIDLPMQPIVFRTPDQCAIGSAVVVASFKNRARRAVIAGIEMGQPLPGLLGDQALAAWERATAEFAGDEAVGHAVVRYEEAPELLGMLGRFGRLSQATRALNRYYAQSPRLFVYPRPRLDNRPDGMRIPADAAFNRSDDTLIRRITFPSIRKSVLSARFRQGGSVAAMLPESGNGPDVLWRHYLNAPDLRRELMMGTKVLQDVLQALIWEDHPEVGAVAGVAPDVIRWLSRIAHASTIAAAFGIVPDVTEAMAGPVRFTPTPAALTELFLMHWAARKAALALPPDTWEARCLPILIAAKAIGALVCRAGLRQAYVAASRAAHRALLAGEICLPPVDVA